MTKAFIAAGIGFLVALGVLALGYAVGARAPAPVAAGQPDRAAVEAVVRNYLLTNPEILIEVQQSLQARQQQAERVAQVEAIRADAAEIFEAGYDGVVGNPEGSVTVVEFFDYNCGYCRRALDDMTQLVETDSDLRFVLKEFPILGPDSYSAHVVSMAFRALQPQLYGEFHHALLSGERATEESAVAVALSLGADEDALRLEMENPQIEEAFARTYELARQLSITGTPSYVVGEEIVFGAVGAAALAESIAAARP